MLVYSKKEQTGFTLIELLIVIFVIGVLAAFLLPNFMSSRQRARDSQRKHDLMEIKNALRLYYNDNQVYPGSVSFGSQFADGGTVYMNLVPDDPQPDESYSYCADTTNDAFVLMAELENEGDTSGVNDQANSQCDGICTISCPTGANCYYVCAN